MFLTHTRSRRVGRTWRNFYSWSNSDCGCHGNSSRRHRLWIRKKNKTEILEQFVPIQSNNSYCGHNDFSCLCILDYQLIVIIINSAFKHMFFGISKLLANTFYTSSCSSSDFNVVCCWLKILPWGMERHGLGRSCSVQTCT